MAFFKKRFNKSQNENDETENKQSALRRIMSNNKNSRKESSTETVNNANNTTNSDNTTATTAETPSTPTTPRLQSFRSTEFRPTHYEQVRDHEFLDEAGNLLTYSGIVSKTEEGFMTPSGQGVLRYPNNTAYEGEFEDGRRVGIGKLKILSAHTRKPGSRRLSNRFDSKEVYVLATWVDDHPSEDKPCKIIYENGDMYWGCVKIVHPPYGHSNSSSSSTNQSGDLATTPQREKKSPFRLGRFRSKPKPETSANTNSSSTNSDTNDNSGVSNTSAANGDAQSLLYASDSRDSSKPLYYSLHHFARHKEGELHQKLDNEKYFGSWKLNQRHGFGIQMKGNGERYYGHWKEDRFHGLGLFIFTDGTMYNGPFERGLRSSHYRQIKFASAKTETNGQKQKDDVASSNGRKIAYRGVMYFPNGDRLEGLWKGDDVQEAKFTKGGFGNCNLVHLQLIKKSLTDAIRRKEAIREYSYDYATVWKWQHYFESRADEWQAQKSVMAQQLRKTSQSAATGIIVLSPEALTTVVKKILTDRSHFMKKIIEYFTVSFHGSYTTLGSVSLVDASLLHNAVDDVKSLTHVVLKHLRNFVNEAVDPNILDSDRRLSDRLRMVVSDYIQKCIYDTLIQLYRATYQDQYILMEAKLKSLENVTLANFGVDPMFQPPTVDTRQQPMTPVQLAVNAAENCVSPQTINSASAFTHSRGSSCLSGDFATDLDLTNQHPQDRQQQQQQQVEQGPQQEQQQQEQKLQEPKQQELEQQQQQQAEQQQQKQQEQQQVAHREPLKDHESEPKTATTLQPQTKTRSRSRGMVLFVDQVRVPVTLQTDEPASEAPTTAATVTAEVSESPSLPASTTEAASDSSSTTIDAAAAMNTSGALSPSTAQSRQSVISPTISPSMTPSKTPKEIAFESDTFSSSSMTGQQQPYRECIVKLESLDRCRCASEKVECLSELRNLIMNTMKEYRTHNRLALGKSVEDDDWEPGADDITPVYNYIWLKANINHYAHFHFINEFRDEACELSSVLHTITYYEGFLDLSMELDPHSRDDQGVLIPPVMIANEIQQIILSSRYSRTLLPHATVSAASFYWLPAVLVHIGLEVGNLLTQHHNEDVTNLSLTLPDNIGVLEHISTVHNLLGEAKLIGFTVAVISQRGASLSVGASPVAMDDTDTADDELSEHSQFTEDEAAVAADSPKQAVVRFTRLYPPHIYSTLSLMISRFLKFEM